MSKTNWTTDLSLKRYYIITTPKMLSELSVDDMIDDLDDGWRIKARRLQARRWRKIKHQLV